jgi:hypothetical protein
MLYLRRTPAKSEYQLSASIGSVRLRRLANGMPGLASLRKRTKASVGRAETAVDLNGAVTLSTYSTNEHCAL